MKKFGLPALPSQDNIQLVACTKRCYQSATKTMSGEGRRAWDTDTSNREYENSSEAMLIDWLVVHGNYAKWKGNNNGISKREIQKEIADQINKKGAEMGIQRGRTADQVGSKIVWCETKFRETKQWVENTGQGIRDEMGEDSFKEKVEKEWFRHFYVLQPIMSERACMGALVNTDEYETRILQDTLAIENHEDDVDENAAVTAAADEPLTPVRDIAFANTLDTSQEQEGQEEDVNLSPPDMEERSVRSVAASRVSRASDIRKRHVASMQQKTPEEMRNMLEILNGSRAMDRETAQKQLEEQIRHNREMEIIESKKARTQARQSVYDVLEKSINLFLSSKKVYEEMKGSMTKDEIAQAVPSCIKCFDFHSMTEEERNKYAKHYNDWAKENELSDRINPDLFN